METAANWLPVRYEIVRLIGKGGMGEVYLARDRELGREVAVKRILAQQAAGIDVDRFVAEARLLGKISHPNVVKLYDAAVGGREPFIVMESLRGMSLARAQAAGVLQQAEKLELIVQILDALDHVHGLGIVHRDLKPSNVFLRSRSDAVLIDFGLARQEGSPRLTSLGEVVGTPYFMAPERILDGLPASPACDIFAVSMMGLEMLSDGQVHAGEEERKDLSQAQIFSSLASEAYLDVASKLMRPHGRVGQILLQGLARSPQKRPASASEMARLLREVMAPAAPVPAPTQHGGTAITEPEPGGRDDGAVPGMPAVAGPVAALEKRLSGARPVARDPRLLGQGIEAKPMETDRGRRGAGRKWAGAGLALAALACLSAQAMIRTRNAELPGRPAPTADAPRPTAGPPNARAELEALSGRLSGWTASGLCSQLCQRLPDGSLRRLATRDAIARAGSMLSTARLGELSAPLGSAFQPLLTDPRSYLFYRELVLCHALERVAGRGRVPGSKVLELLPQELQPGLVPPGSNRRFVAELSSRRPLTNQSALAFTLRLPDLAGVRQCCLLLRAATTDPDSVAWLKLNGKTEVALMTARARRSSILAHTVPVGMIRPGENSFELRAESVCEPQVSIGELESFEALLYP
ncbi:MAG: serine/threonine protein kinase [Candidatus Wallbacteria bacterium]|nr:serine/threonine protein kinase [Candidatus Wallbacteria bacterium]